MSNYYFRLITVLFYIAVDVNAEFELKTVENTTSISPGSKIIILRGRSTEVPKGRALEDFPVVAMKRNRNSNDKAPKDTEIKSSAFSLDNNDDVLSSLVNTETKVPLIVLSEKNANIAVDRMAFDDNPESTGKLNGDSLEENLKTSELRATEFTIENDDDILRNPNDSNQDYDLSRIVSSEDQTDTSKEESPDLLDSFKRDDIIIFRDDGKLNSEMHDDYYRRSDFGVPNLQIDELKNNNPDTLNVADEGTSAKDLVFLETKARSGERLFFDDDDEFDSVDERRFDGNNNEDRTVYPEYNSVPTGIRPFETLRFNGRLIYPTIIPTILGPRILFQPILRPLNTQTPIYLNTQPNRFLRDLNPKLRLMSEERSLLIGPREEQFTKSNSFVTNSDSNTYPYVPPYQNNLELIR
ncbi:hypothetical protein K1T71_013917 [Dendrolimus kikuchii]|uniref:Uncharacterized protein n=1 Tax=Dendrolimus kikuchii TaxID=765133 RepID=A0ACC1CG52_9NEOP|nr:hypothetical protein K1T71_013917 [Dendrolimus kikuchii]